MILDDFTKRILNIPKENPIVAIDGRCAAGKTTLAKHLAEKIGGTVVHMDDFFLRREQRTPERYATVGGNVDYERFLEEVLEPLSFNEMCYYYPFDCSTMTIQKDVVFVDGTKPVIVEGSYSLRPELRQFYDFKIFLDVDPQKQIERIAKRNPDKLERFRKEWIPYEEMYFDTYNIRKVANIVIDTSEEF